MDPDHRVIKGGDCSISIMASNTFVVKSFSVLVHIAISDYFSINFWVDCD